MPTSLTREVETDVLIIGAGPAGLFAANALARAGVKVKIIDQKYGSVLIMLGSRTYSVAPRAVRISSGQADGIQSRTVEVLQVYPYTYSGLLEQT